MRDPEALWDKIDWLYKKLHAIPMPNDWKTPWAYEEDEDPYNQEREEYNERLEVAEHAYEQLTGKQWPDKTGDMSMREGKKTMRLSIKQLRSLVTEAAFDPQPTKVAGSGGNRHELAKQLFNRVLDTAQFAKRTGHRDMGDELEALAYDHMHETGLDLGEGNKQKRRVK